MFINLSNHPSHRWDENQLNEARKYGDIVDIPFPNIDPYVSKIDIHDLAMEYSLKILEYHPEAVMVQGEMTFTYEIVRLLKEKGLYVVCACTKRDSYETIDEQRNTIKKSIFKFIGFREY